MERIIKDLDGTINIKNIEKFIDKMENSEINSNKKDFKGRTFCIELGISYFKLLNADYDKLIQYKIIKKCNNFVKEYNIKNYKLDKVICKIYKYKNQSELYFYVWFITDEKELKEVKKMKNYLVGLKTGGLMEDPDIKIIKIETIFAETPEQAEKLYNEKHNCSFYYAKCIGEE